jgi:hypothetical protein
MGVSGLRHAPAALYPHRRDPQYPLNRRLGEPQSWSGHRDYKKNPLPLPGIKPQSYSPQSDTILTELPLLTPVKILSKLMSCCLSVLMCYYFRYNIFRFPNFLTNNLHINTKLYNKVQLNVSTTNFK